jgi:prepilin-type N-terminal cleavage/methylation domain-containing protein
MTRDITRTSRTPSLAAEAFSLIELIAVISIAGILAITATPVFSSITGVRRDVAARHLLRDLSFACQHGVATGSVTWVVFESPERWSVLVEDPANPGRAGAGALADVVTNLPMSVQVGRGEYSGVAIESVEFDAGSEVGFDYLGRPLTGDGVFLVEQGAVTLTGGRAVFVEPVTGLAWVELP